MGNPLLTFWHMLVEPRPDEARHPLPEQGSPEPRVRAVPSTGAIFLVLRRMAVVGWAHANTARPGRWSPGPWTPGDGYWWWSIARRIGSTRWHCNPCAPMPPH
jgi:hypothetical protein